MDKKIIEDKEIWRLRTKKMWTQEKIAEKLGISITVVSRTLVSLAKKYRIEFEDQVCKIKAEQISQLEMICSEAIDAWVSGRKSGSYNSSLLTVAMKGMEEIRKVAGIEYVKNEKDDEKKGELTESERLARISELASKLYEK